MKIKKITGIVLSSVRTGEADSIVKIFTKESGKCDFLFKGIRKSKRRSQLILESGTVADLIYYSHERKNISIVNEFHIHKHFTEAGKNFSKTLLLYFLIETVEKTTGYNDSNRPVFDLLAAGLETISKTEHTEHLSAFFVLHLLRIHGILPDFSKCKICGEKNNHNFMIDGHDFHPMCGKCMPLASGHALFSKKAGDFIREAAHSKFFSINHERFPGHDIQNLLFHMTLFTESYFHVNIKSRRLFLSNMQLAKAPCSYSGVAKNT